MCIFLFLFQGRIVMFRHIEPFLMMTGIFLFGNDHYIWGGWREGYGFFLGGGVLFCLWLYFFYCFFLLILQVRKKYDMIFVWCEKHAPLIKIIDSS